MSSSTRQTAPARLSLTKRLPGMSMDKLNAYRASADRISVDLAHPKQASALRAVPKIAAEIRRRADAKAD